MQSGGGAEHATICRKIVASLAFICTEKKRKTEKQRWRGVFVPILIFRTV